MRNEMEGTSALIPHSATKNIVRRIRGRTKRLTRRSEGDYHNVPPVVKGYRGENRLTREFTALAFPIEREPRNNG